MRHGESVWNAQNRFTGFANIPLSPRGLLQAQQAGPILKQYQPSMVFTSALLRAQQTITTALTEIGHAPVLFEDRPSDQIHDYHAQDPTFTPVFWHCALNERDYGDLRGMHRDDAMQQFGQEQVHQWRRSYHAVPPQGESLKMTYERVVPYYESVIAPYLRSNNIIVCAHGNSIRALLSYLFKLSEYALLSLEIPLAQPIALTFNGQEYQSIDSFQDVL